MDNRVYVITHRCYEYDDFDFGCFNNIVYMSTNESKRDDVFERLRKSKLNPPKDSPFFKDFEVGENLHNFFEYYYGKWCYEYSVDDFVLEDESKLF